MTTITMIIIEANAEEDEIPEKKKHAEKWIRDFPRCVLVTEVLFHFGIINMFKETSV